MMYQSSKSRIGGCRNFIMILVPLWLLLFIWTITNPVTEALIVNPITTTRTTTTRPSSRDNSNTKFMSHNNDEIDKDDSHQDDLTTKKTTYDCSDMQRRKFFVPATVAAASSVTLLMANPSESWAGEVGAKITKAVTTSELGISVRTSVVKGAQLIDQIDGKWEQFSDKYSLGSERSKQGQRPKPKIIPEPLPLDVTMGRKIIDACNQVFSTTSGIRLNIIEDRATMVANRVRISFERSGVSNLSQERPLSFENAQQFNFVMYSTFKAYSELIMERQLAFNPLRSSFEKQLGEVLVNLLLPEYIPPIMPSNDADDETKKRAIKESFTWIDKLCKVLQERGLVALAERSAVDDEKVLDWIDDVIDLEFTVAVDFDSTLNSQILLQEQGLRLYPSLARVAVTYMLQQSVAPNQKVAVMDYYFDTDYNSDPDKFEVKEVLLSITIENP